MISRKIKLTEDNRIRIKLAKGAIQESLPEKAIANLYTLQIPKLDEELTILSARLNEFKKDDRLGLQSIDQRSARYNRLLKSILDLIISLEEDFGEGDQIIQKVNIYLKQRYQHRLSQKLAGRQPVNLRRYASGVGSSEEAQAMFLDTVLMGEEVQSEITRTFEDAFGRLLLVGHPGAGKTTLLLQLALELLAKQQRELPVIVNLGTWQALYGSLEKWLDEILWLELGVSKTLAHQMLHDTSFILLLDGLDEVTEKNRASCLEAIGQYGAKSEHSYVICSRIEEYKKTIRDAPVHLQIEVRPLDKEQIQKELERMGRKQPEAVPLLHALKKDTLLGKAMETPFYFNTTQLLFAGGKKWHDWEFMADNIEGRKREILERFVYLGLNYSKEKNFPANKAGKWLSFLARQMKHENLVNFELVNLQPYWWKGSQMQLFLSGIFYGLSFGLVLLVYLLIELFLPIMIFGISDGLIFGLGFGLIIGTVIGLILLSVSKFFKISTPRLVSSLVSGLVFSLFFWPILILVLVSIEGVITGLIYGFMYGIIGLPIAGLLYGIVATKRTLRNSERLFWSWGKFKKMWKKELIQRMKNGLKFGLVFGLASGLVFGVVDLLFGPLPFLPFIWQPTGIGQYLSLWFGYWLKLALGLSLSISLINALTLAGIKNAYFLQINKPYQRFVYALKKFNLAILKHFTFRYLLYKKGCLPLRLVDFLEEMAKRNIMESEGGRWRFRHRLIQEYFENLEDN